jgi:hypothetical protein
LRRTRGVANMKNVELKLRAGAGRATNETKRAQTSDSQTSDIAYTCIS